MSSVKTLLGRKIRQLRKEHNWTQEYLSEKLGINSQSLLRIENGKTFPTVQNLEKIAEIFEIDISELFNNKSFDDISELKKEILSTIKTLDYNKTRVLYNFLFAIK